MLLSLLKASGKVIINSDPYKGQSGAVYKVE
jgi:hypothetical protein